MEPEVTAKNTKAQILDAYFKYEKWLREKETEGLLNLKNQQIESLQNIIMEMEQQVKEATAKADNSEKSVKDIAMKAIESANKMWVIEREHLATSARDNN